MANKFDVETFQHLSSSPAFVNAYGCRLHIPNSVASIEFHTLGLLRSKFEDNISETDMIGINDKDGNPVFWGSFDELIKKLK